MKIFKSTDQSGQVIVIVGIVLIVLVVLVGLAIDSGRAYSVKAKLNAALDAAGIAAARAIADSNDEAGAAALTFFNSNYPTEYMHSTPIFCPPGGVPTINTDSSSGDTTITVWATADMPTMFMRVVGQDTVDVGATTTANRRAVDLALVIDNTTSLMMGGTDYSPMVIQRSKDFIDHFSETIDRVALITYANGATVPVHFTAGRGFNKQGVKDAIDAMYFGNPGTGDYQYTNSAEGFWNARHEINTATNPSNLKVIVFFTDGSPNTFSSTFEFDSDPDHAGSIFTGDSTSPNTPNGLWKHTVIKEEVSSPWDFGSSILNELTQLPTNYNPCNAGDSDDPHTNPDLTCTDPNEFLVLNPGHPRRPVDQYNQSGTWTQRRNRLWRRVNRAARNLVEDMAEAARMNDIHVYTLGLGTNLAVETGPDDEEGQYILMRMANDKDMVGDYLEYNPNQLEGFYCYAEDDLQECYNKLVEEIIRLTI